MADALNISHISERAHAIMQRQVYISLTMGDKWVMIVSTDIEYFIFSISFYCFIYLLRLHHFEPQSA